MKGNVTFLSLIAALAILATSCGVYGDLDYAEVTRYGTPYVWEGTTYYFYKNTYYVPHYVNGVYVMRHAPDVPRHHFHPKNNRPRPTGGYYKHDNGKHKGHYKQKDYYKHDNGYHDDHHKEKKGKKGKH